MIRPTDDSHWCYNRWRFACRVMVVGMQTDDLTDCSFAGCFVRASWGLVRSIGCIKFYCKFILNFSDPHKFDRICLSPTTVGWIANEKKRRRLKENKKKSKSRLANHFNLRSKRRNQNTNNIENFLTNVKFVTTMMWMKMMMMNNADLIFMWFLFVYVLVCVCLLIFLYQLHQYYEELSNGILLNEFDIGLRGDKPNKK